MKTCCSEEEPCGEGQGDCDGDDYKCGPGYGCGRDNCGSNFYNGTDCCTKGKINRKPLYFFTNLTQKRRKRILQVCQFYFFLFAYDTNDTTEVEENKDENNVSEVALAEANMAIGGVSNIHEYEPMNNGTPGDKEDMQEVHVNIHLLHQTLRPVTTDSFSIGNIHREPLNHENFAVTFIVLLLAGNNLH